MKTLCVEHGSGAPGPVNLDLQVFKKEILMTKIKSVLIAVAFALGCLTVTYAKSYELAFETSMEVGKVQLKPGKYILVLRGDNAVFTNTRRESYTTPVKVENGTKKFKATGVDSVANKIKSIELGGSTIRLDFIE
jgi:hypothetical protein